MRLGDEQRTARRPSGLYAGGCGYGGSASPDVTALIHTAVKPAASLQVHCAPWKASQRGAANLVLIEQDRDAPLRRGHASGRCFWRCAGAGRSAQHRRHARSASRVVVERTALSAPVPARAPTRSPTRARRVFGERSAPSFADSARARGAAGTPMRWSSSSGWKEFRSPTSPTSVVLTAAGGSSRQAQHVSRQPPSRILQHRAPRHPAELGARTALSRRAMLRSMSY